MEINVKFKGAAVMGDTIKVVVKVSDKKETKKGDKGIVTFDQIVKNQRDEEQ